MCFTIKCAVCPHFTHFAADYAVKGGKGDLPAAVALRYLRAQIGASRCLGWLLRQVHLHAVAARHEVQGIMAVHPQFRIWPWWPAGPWG